MKTYQLENLLRTNSDLLVRNYDKRKAIRRFKVRNWIRRIVLGIVLLALTFGLFQFLCNCAWIIWLQGAN